MKMLAQRCREKRKAHSQDWLCHGKERERSSSAFAVLEKFHLPEPLFGFLLGFVGAAEILLAVFRKKLCNRQQTF
jgi:hypothetical protein